MPEYYCRKCGSEDLHYVNIAVYTDGTEIPVTVFCWGCKFMGEPNVEYSYDEKMDLIRDHVIPLDKFLSLSK